MKTLSVALLFLLSLVTLFAAARADALAEPRITPRLSAPQPLALMPEGEEQQGDEGDKDTDDEADEEEYRGLSQRAALELVDPGALDHILRLRAAVRAGR
jgi:hypothetical protein